MSSKKVLKGLQKKMTPHKFFLDIIKKTIDSQKIKHYAYKRPLQAASFGSRGIILKHI